MGAIRRFEEIEAWKAARKLANIIYELSDNDPFARDFGLKDQIRRAAVSVMSNIAEGFESRTPGQFIDLLGRAKGSAGEVRSQLYIALDRGYIDQNQFKQAYELADKAGRQIYRFMLYLKTNPRQVRERHPIYYVKRSTLNVGSPEKRSKKPRRELNMRNDLAKYTERFQLSVYAFWFFQ